MSVLERTISYDQVIAWGATRSNDERDVRRWFGDRESVTIGEALAAPTAAGRIFWAVMREEVLPAEVMHRLAVDAGRRFLDRLQERGVYIDFRSRRVLDAKEAWLCGEISLGGLMAAHRKAMQARADVSELEDPLVSAGAHVACEAGGEDASLSFRNVYYLVHEAREAENSLLAAEFSAEALQAEAVEAVRRVLGEHAG